MANQELTLDLTDDCGFHSRFEKLVDDARDLIRPPKQEGELIPGHLIDFSCKEGEMLLARVKIRADNYYCIGYQRPGDQIVYEFKDDSTPNGAIPGSEKLKFKVKYPDNLEGKSLGYYSFAHAVRELGGDNHKEKAQVHLLTIALVVSESIRFRWISKHFVRIFENRSGWLMEEWMNFIIHNWKLLTKLAREYASLTDGVTEADLPIEPNEEDDEVMLVLDYNVFGFENGHRAAAVCTVKLLPE